MELLGKCFYVSGAYKQKGYYSIDRAMIFVQLNVQCNLSSPIKYDAIQRLYSQLSPYIKKPAAESRQL